MTKLLTVAVPVYNTKKYLRRCLDSLLQNDILDELEIIAVNDGSKDSSLEILKEYKSKFPNTVRIVDKENGGHGSAVNSGIANASGKYFRVIDSDDWVSAENFSEFVHRLSKEDADLVVTDYRREYSLDSRTELFEFSNLEDGKTYEFEDFDIALLSGEYFVMAGSTYKTELLRKCGLSLFEKTYYVDMQYNIVPISEIKTFSYYRLDIYRYMIGRAEQSVSLASFVRNSLDHERVIKFCISFFSELQKNASETVILYLSVIMNYFLYTHYQIFCKHSKKRYASFSSIKAFDAFLKEASPYLYEKSNGIDFIKNHRKTKFLFVLLGIPFINKLFGSLYYFAKRVKRLMSRV